MQGFAYEPSGDGWVVSGYTGKDRDVDIPARIDGKPVRLIASNAFAENATIASVRVPDTVTFIGNYAFSSCPSLEQAHIDASLEALNLGLFWNCPRLADVTLPEGLVNLGDGAFRDCTGLRTIEVPFTVQRIGDRAFSGCSSLETIMLPGACTTIERSAFRDCASLSSVSVHDTLAYVGPRAFQGCPHLDGIGIVGPNAQNAVAAFANHGMTYLVADYAIELDLMPFDEAKKLLNTGTDEMRAFAARVATRHPERLSEIVSKQKMSRLLAKHGRTEELRVLEDVPRFLDPDTLKACIEDASEAGHAQTTAYLMDVLARTDDSGARNTSATASSLKL